MVCDHQEIDSHLASQGAGDVDILGDDDVAVLIPGHVLIAGGQVAVGISGHTLIAGKMVLLCGVSA